MSDEALNDAWRAGQGPPEEAARTPSRRGRPREAGRTAPQRTTRRTGTAQQQVPHSPGVGQQDPAGEPLVENQRTPLVWCPLPSSLISLHTVFLLKRGLQKRVGKLLSFPSPAAIGQDRRSKAPASCLAHVARIFLASWEVGRTVPSMSGMGWHDVGCRA